MQLDRKSLIKFLLLIILVAIIMLTWQYQQIYEQHARETPLHRSQDATFHFSWLHVAGGKFVDDQNRQVTLLGLNTTGLEYGYASGQDMTESHILQLSRLFNMNLWRVAINVSWWNDNDYVPVKNLYYRDWIRQQIQWMQQNNNYVEIDPTTYALLPPCGGGINFCIAQDTLNSPPWTEQQILDATIKFWDSIVPMYINDPAILYDALNEPAPPVLRNCHQDNSTIIDTIQKINPKALIFVYNAVNLIIANGKVSASMDDTQPNLVYDWHVYDDPAWPWQSKLESFGPIYRWVQQHNHAVDIGEWGDRQLTSKKAFADTILDLVKTQGFATSYFNETDLMTNGQLNGLGRLVQQEYASLPPVIGRRTATLSSPPAILPTPAMTPTLSSQSDWRIDAGSQMAYMDSQGNIWLSDRGFSGGTMYDWGNVPIANTADPRIYQTEHWDTGTWTATYPVPNGNYIVRLYFAENHTEFTAGSRVFNVAIQGNTVLANFDIVAQAGGVRTALVKTFSVAVTSGSVNFTFTSIIQNAEINGVEIIPEK